ncbi:MAG: glutamate 5-kinase [bacterium]
MTKVKKIKRIVIKLGSRVLAGPGGGLDEQFLEEFTSSLARLHQQGFEIILVTSGAVRTGVPKLKMDSKKIGIAQKQAAAAVGQGILISKYIDLFTRSNIVVAQILITADIVRERKSYLNARNTLRTLIDMRVIPIINENDTVAYDEIKFGDNDRLSAMSAILVDADLLIILSDVMGLCDKDPRTCDKAELVKEVTEITPELFEVAAGPLEDGGVGGMSTKLAAAEMAMECGVRMVIADGRETRVVERIVEGEKVGTTFLSKTDALSGRKKWLAFGCTIEGRVVVNDGAKLMIKNKGKSLLPSGVIRVDNDFDHGACIEVCGEDGSCFGKGLAVYSSAEIRRIQGRQSTEIKDILGYKIADVVVHRDDLALL